MLSKLNKPVVIISVSVYSLIFLAILFFPEVTASGVTKTYEASMNLTGWIYELAYAFVFLLILYFGFSKFGKIRLGGKDAKPEYSTFAWVGMLFCAGLGVGLVFFGVIEPVTHYLSSPFAENGTAAAATEAMRITFFHWSVLPWAIYAMVGLCIGYFCHNHGLPPLISTAFYPLLGEKGVKGIWGKIIDSFSLIALICGISMSLGFAAIQSTTGLSTEFGFENSFLFTACFAVGIGLCAMCSAISGLKKGVRLLSEFNTYLVIAFIVFMLIVGPTSHIIKIFFEGNGQMLSSFVGSLFFLDAFGAAAEKVGFPWIESWTVMYWAWWVAFAPFVGSFLAEISKGRTIREFVITCLLAPGLLCCLWFTCFGGTAIYMDLTELPGLAAAALESTEASLFVFLDAFPLSNVTIIFAIILIMTLIITSMDSATYMASVFSVNEKKDATISIRVFWAFYVIINAVLMIYIGGLNTLKYAAIVLAFPFMLIIVLMTYCLFLESCRVAKGNKEVKVPILTAVFNRWTRKKTEE